MYRYILSIGLLISCIACTPKDSIPQAVVSDTPTRTITIPVQVLGGGGDEVPNITSPNFDEEPIGPESFVVRPGPEILVTDPINNRVIWFDEEGNYISHQDLNFKPRNLSFQSDRILVEDALTGDQYEVHDFGQPTLLSAAAVEQSRGDAPSVSFVNTTRTQVSLSWPGRGESGAVEVALPSSMQPAISVRGEPTQADDELLLVVETSRAGEGISVQTSANIYDAKGAIQHAWQAQQLPSYISLSNAFQVEGEQFYQMVVTEEAIEILIYN